MLSLEESGCADETSRRRAVNRRRLVSVVIFFLTVYILSDELWRTLGEKVVRLSIFTVWNVVLFSIAWTNLAVLPERS